MAPSVELNAGSKPEADWKSTALVVVDMQNDLMLPGGPLHVAGCSSIRERNKGSSQRPFRRSTCCMDMSQQISLTFETWALVLRWWTSGLTATKKSIGLCLQFTMAPSGCLGYVKATCGPRAQLCFPPPVVSQDECLGSLLLLSIEEFLLT